MNELCIRCGKPTPYDVRTPIPLRRYFIEGSGQLCENCWATLYERKEKWLFNLQESKSAPDVDTNMNG